MSGTAPPFVIFALPRSRTYWCSRFLSYNGWICGHEEVRHLRSLEDIRSWLSMPATGTIETCAAPFWRYLLKVRPDARVAVIRRPVEESLASLLLGVPVAFDADKLERHLHYLDHKLDQVEARVPGVLSVSYRDLATEEGCARLFEHCLPYRHDPLWWQGYAGLNLQIDVPALFRYMTAHKPQLDKLGKTVRHRIVQAMQPVSVDAGDGVTFQCETFVAHLEARALFAEHLIQTDQAPDDWQRKNLPLLKTLYEIGALQIMTARCNGRMFGYLLSIVAPSFDSPDLTEAQHTIFFASPEIRNLGMRLQRAANEALRARGVDQIYMRTGNRGLGPRLGAYYRRLGAEEIGTLYRLEAA
jgi:hypothetical protein